MLTAFRMFRQDRSLTAVLVAMLFVATIAASIAPYQALIGITVFGFSDSGYAALMVCGAAMSVAASVSTGIISDQTGQRKLLAMVGAATLSVCAALVWASMATWAYVLLFVVGLPMGFSTLGQIFAIGRVACADAPSALRDNVLTILRSAMAAPFLVVLPLWSLVFAGGAELRLIFPVLTFAATGIFATFAFGLPRASRSAPPAKSGLGFFASLRELTHPRVTGRLILIAAMLAANTIYMTSMGLVFESALGPTEGTVRTARFAAIIAGLEVPFMLSLTLVTARYAKSTILFAAIAIYAVFLVAFPTLSGSAWVWVLTIPAAAGASALLTLPIAYFQDLLHARPGAGASLQSVNQVTSQMIAGAVFWVGTSLASYGAVMTIGAAVALAAAVMLWIVDHRAQAA